MATPTRVKVDKLLRYASVDREICPENPNYKTIGYIRVQYDCEQSSSVMKWRCMVSEISVLHTGQRAHSVAVEVMF